VKENKMNVLSLFDGMSCTQLALKSIGVSPNKYYAAEWDKYASSITQKNFPDTIPLGDVTDWFHWDVDWSTIDLIVAGFPCQSWSMAGARLGDRDARGQLFWVTLDIIQHVLEANPNAKFLMKNVKMKAAFEQYITHHTQEALGVVNKHLINSALVSAQNRQRYYWTNIEGIEQPKDKGVVLKDILENGVTDREKAHCIDANYFKGGNLKSYFEKHRRQLVFSPNGLCHVGDADLNGNQSIKRVLDVKDMTWRKLTPLECERLQTVPDGYTEGVSNTQRYKMLGNGFTVDVIAHILSNLEQVK
tara:strand:- start:718 stop:1626 length:909 start_codon:yes stop_codon:yes gene_type:complete